MSPLSGWPTLADCDLRSHNGGVAPDAAIRYRSHTSEPKDPNAFEAVEVTRNGQP